MSDVINEVTEARRVVDRVYEIVKASGKACYKYHDTASSSSQNLANIVNFHNKYSDGIDVSVHFNANVHTNSPRGVEVCYYSSSTVASSVSKAISDASGLKNRGAKQRTGLYFLKCTNKPSILIEVCFGDSTEDCQIYRNKFEDICQAIAKTLIGNITVLAPSSSPTAPAVPSTSSTAKPKSNIEKAKEYVGNRCKELQEKLIVCGYSCGSHGADGIFGAGTKSRVINYQKSKGLTADGIVGKNTWRKLLGL